MRPSSRTADRSLDLGRSSVDGRRKWEVGIAGDSSPSSGARKTRNFPGSPANWLGIAVRRAWTHVSLSKFIASKIYFVECDVILEVPSHSRCCSVTWKFITSMHFMHFIEWWSNIFIPANRRKRNWRDFEVSCSFVSICFECVLFYRTG